MNQQRNNADFVSVAPIKRQREIRPINKTKKQSGVSSILTICAVMLCCMLMLSVAFIEEPYLQTSAGGYSAQPRTLGEEILGRLVYLCEEFVDVFTPIKYICKKHGIQEQVLDSMIYGHRCYFCSYEKRGLNCRHSIEYVKSIIESYNGNMLLNPDDYIGSNIRNLEIQCGLCGKKYITKGLLY